MRVLLAAAVVLLLAPALATASSSDSDPPDGITVTVLRIEGKGVYVTWTPAPAATSYDIYRGTDLGTLHYVASTPNLEYTDPSPPGADVWYQIISEVPTSIPDDVGSPVKGRCLAVRGATGVSVTVANCMPGRMPWP